MGSNFNCSHDVNVLMNVINKSFPIYSDKWDKMIGEKPIYENTLKYLD